MNRKTKNIKYNIKDLPIEERPRERLIRLGPENLSNAELLAIIIGTGSIKENVLNLANRLLTNYDIKRLSQTTITELKKITGIKDAKACQIVAAFELGKRLSIIKNLKKQIITPSDIADLFMPSMRHLKKELLKGVYVDSKCKIIKYETIAAGGLNTNIIHPREVFKTAILEDAAAIILVHNHPSGDSIPSPDDINLTKKLKQIGKLIGIELLDHIIIGDNEYVSFKERGII
jgi:DNA repair protein RadC